MKLKIKKLSQEAQIPQKAFNSDTGFDLVATSDPNIKDGYVEYKTGLSIQPEPGYATQIRPRSSISKYDLVLCNSVGTIDNAYLGELILRFKFVPQYDLNNALLVDMSKCTDLECDCYHPPKPDPFKIKNLTPRLYKKGDKIGQLVIEKIENCEILEVDNLEITDRGSGGFGSSGN